MLDLGTAASALILEHALTMLLLLVGLLSVRGTWQRYVPWVVLAGAGLSLLTPSHTIAFFWPLLSFAVLPPLLWYVAIQLPKVRPKTTLRPWLAWGITVGMITAALSLAGAMPPASALLLAILAASLMWQLRGTTSESVGLGAFGWLALALLLAEVDVAISPLRPVVANVVAGSGLGLLFGFAGVRLALQFSDDRWRDVLCLGVTYVAYLAAIPIEVSSVVAALAAALMLAEYGYRAGVWSSESALPTPLDNPAVFAVASGAFIVLGWQGHVDLTMAHSLGIVLGLGAAALALAVGYLFTLVDLEQREGLLRTALVQERRLFLLLVGTFLLWPEAAVLAPWPLIVALVAAAVGLVLSLVVVHALFDVFGVKVRRSTAAPEVEEIHVPEKERSGGTIRVWRN